MRYQATLTSKGQVTLPAQLRRKLGLHAGDSIVFREGENGWILERQASTLADLRGAVRLSRPITMGELDAMIEGARASRGSSALASNTEDADSAEDGQPE